MNTENNTSAPPNKANHSLGREIIYVLNSCMLNVPIGQTLRELQIAIERLTFAHDAAKEKGLTLHEIDNLLGGDISPGAMDFIKWLHTRKLVRVLVGQNGRLFLEHCVRYYRTIQEVHCITAINLDDETRIKVLERLRLMYPEPTRIVFSSQASLVVGCVIDDGEKVTDMSLKSKMPNLIRNYIGSRHIRESMSHGR